MLPFEEPAFAPFELAAESALPEPETWASESGSRFQQEGDSKQPSGIPSAGSAAFDHHAAYAQLSCHSLYNSDLCLDTFLP